MPDKPLRVIHIMSEFGGGISSFILDKAEALANQDVQIDVLTFDTPSARLEQAIAATGGQIYKVPNPVKESLMQSVKQTNAIFNQLPKNTLVHCNYGMDLALIFYLVAKKNRLKFAIHAHTAEPDNTNDLRRHLNRWMADYKLSCGLRATENIFGRQALEKNDVVHIPNSINLKNFFGKNRAASLKSEAYGQENQHKFIISQIARFHEVKNHAFSLEVIEELAKTELDFLWLFFGQGKLEDEIKQAVAERKLEGYVKFMGRRNDISELYQTMDLMVLPSHFEGLSTVAIESQASGKKILLSDIQTRETDLDLGLTEFLPIENGAQDVEAWVQVILANQQPANVSPELIQEKFEQKKFTSATSAALYVEFLKGNISSYRI